MKKGRAAVFRIRDIGDVKSIIYRHAQVAAPRATHDQLCGIVTEVFEQFEDKVMDTKNTHALMDMTEELAEGYIDA